MAYWTQFSLASLGLVGAGVGLAAWSSSTYWHRTTLQLIDKFTQPISQPGLKTVTFKNFERLPSPVARYLRFALTEGQPLIRSVRISQVGELRNGGIKDRWLPFKATQFISPQPLGFVWDASIHIAPLMRVRVRDAYVAGQGLAQVNAFSLVTLANEYGKAELTAGALQRYLAEAVWCPTALLPTAGVQWSPIDSDKALATLTNSGSTVSLEFHFSSAGEITKIYTPGRYREVNGKYELTPWEGHYRNYQERDGMQIPTEGDVEWHLPSGRLPVWKGRNVKVEYDFAQ